MADNKASQRGVRAIYCAEGSTHLYSSPPSMLTPADLYQVKENPALRQLLKDCNVYVIAARPRILIDPDEFSLKGCSFHGRFIVQRPDGVVRVPFAWRLPPDWESADAGCTAVVLAGTHIELNSPGRTSTLR